VDEKIHPSGNVIIKFLPLFLINL